MELETGENALPLLLLHRTCHEELRAPEIVQEHQRRQWLDLKLGSQCSKVSCCQR